MTFLDSSAPTDDNTHYPHHSDPSSPDMNTKEHQKSPVAATTPASVDEPTNCSNEGDLLVNPLPSLSNQPLYIVYKNISYKLSVPVNNSRLNPIVDYLFQLYHLGAKYIFRSKTGFADFYRIRDISGCIEPGTMTLIVSPPGSGRSTLLKSLSLCLPPTDGAIYYNGLTQREASSRKCELTKMLSYVDQVDAHFDMLTVRETLEFAHATNTKVQRYEYINHLLEAFSMEECAATPVGQCSGGQRRRLSVMLGLCNPEVRCAFFDQLSDGLDSSVTENLIKYFRAWCRLNTSSIVCTLQQPSPDVFNMFDKIVILRDSFVIYDGPRCDIETYLQALGFPCPDDVDLPSHILHIITQPKIALQELHANQDNDEKQSSQQPQELSITAGKLIPSPVPCISAEEMQNYYESSVLYAKTCQIISKTEQLRHAQGLRNTPSSASSKQLASYDPQEDESCRTTEDQSTTTQLSGPVPSANNRTAPLLSHTMSSGEPTIARFHNGGSGDIASSPSSGTQAESCIALKEFPPLITPQNSLYYGPGYSTSIFNLFSLLVERQIRLQRRDVLLVCSRLIPALVIGFVMGAQYYKIPNDNYERRAAVFQDTLTELGYINLVELGLNIVNRRVIHSQLKLYPTWAYALSVYLGGIPFSLIEALVPFAIVYPMARNTNDVAAVIGSYLTLLISGSVLTAIFRFGASISANIGMAYAIVSPIISILSQLGGFYIREKTLLHGPAYYFLPALYASPFTFGLRALLQLEFFSPRYDYLVVNPNSGELVRAGTLYLELNGVYTTNGWVLWNVFYCMFALFILTICTSIFLYQPHKEYSIGTRRISNEEEDEIDNVGPEALAEDAERIQEQQQDEVSVYISQIHRLEQQHDDYQSRIGHPGGVEHETADDVTRTGESHHLASTNDGMVKLTALTEELPFFPASLSFENIRFTVKAKDDSTGKIINRCLLQNVTGYAHVGTATCLMGSSGAGKTTLLNTLFGFNKGAGQIDGTIKVNGKVVTEKQLAAITGYVEQSTTLFPWDTVYNTILFSARMKLIGTSEEVIARVVDEILEVLELSSMKDMLLGSPFAPILSPSQLKRVSIGCVLAGNPSILMMDEPTTGLSSSEALLVVRCIRRIAKAGRAIICTIHQPSAELFYYFDSMLLLGSGGYTLYFGRLGSRARNLIQFFHSNEHIQHIPLHVNPASWVVDQVSRELPPIAEEQSHEKYKWFIEQFDNTLRDSYPEWDQLGPKQKWIRFLHVSYLQSDVFSRALQFIELLGVDTQAIAIEHAAQQQQHRNSHDETGNTDHVHPSDTQIDDNAAALQLHDPPSRVAPSCIRDNNENLSLLEKRNDMRLPVWKQFLFLFHRSSFLYTRNSSFFYTRLFSVSGLSIVYAFLFLDLRVRNTSQVLTFFAATIIAAGNTCYVWGPTLLPILNDLRPLMYRESAYYRAILWPISFILCEILVTFPMCFFCFIFHYFSVHGSTYADIFFQYWLANYLLCILFASFAIVSSLALPSQSIGEVVQNMYVSLCFSFVGTAIPKPQLNRGFKVILQFFPYFHTGVLMQQGQWLHSDSVLTVYQNGVNVVMKTRDYIAHYLGYSGDIGLSGPSAWRWSILWLFVMIAVFQVSSVIAAAFVRFRMR